MGNEILELSKALNHAIDLLEVSLMGQKGPFADEMHEADIPQLKKVLANNKPSSYEANVL